MQSVFGGNQMLGCSILLGMAAFHGATFCNIVPDHGVLLLRCVGLSQQSQHLARGTKGARFVNERSWSKECLPCSCHANTWFEGCLWFRSLHTCFSTSARYGINVCLVSVTTLAWKESACGKKCLHYTLQSCCVGSLVYPSILSQAPKELGLWLKVSGPKSVFHVAAMIAPWLKGFAWIKPTLCFPPWHAIICECLFFNLIDPFVGQGCVSTEQNSWLDGDQAAYRRTISLNSCYSVAFCHA